MVCKSLNRKIPDNFCAQREAIIIIFVCTISVAGMGFEIFIITLPVMTIRSV